MTPFTTIIKDAEGRTAKYVVNADGSTAEVWHIPMMIPLSQQAG